MCIMFKKKEKNLNFRLKTGKIREIAEMRNLTWYHLAGSITAINR